MSDNQIRVNEKVIEYMSSPILVCRLLPQGIVDKVQILILSEFNDPETKLLVGTKSMPDKYLTTPLSVALIDTLMTSTYCAFADASDVEEDVYATMITGNSGHGRLKLRVFHYVPEVI